MKRASFAILALMACSRPAAVLDRPPCPCATSSFCCDGVCLPTGAGCGGEGDLALSRLSPPSGPVEGGPTITLEGRAFESGAVVTFGDRECAIEALDEQRIDCVLPEGEGAVLRVDVAVTLPDGSRAVLPEAFRYELAPLVERRPLFSQLPSNGLGVAISDIDRDGRPDVVFSDAEGGQPYWYRQTTDLTFETAPLHPRTPKNSGNLFGDFDNDGAEDLLTIARGDRVVVGRTTQLSIVFDDQPPRFEPQSAVHAPDGWLTAGAILDVNGDGHLDFVGCRERYTFPGYSGDVDALFAVALNDGAGSLVEAPHFADTVRRRFGVCRAATLGDYDLDGDLDVFWCGLEGVQRPDGSLDQYAFVSLLENTKDGLREVTDEVGLPDDPPGDCRYAAFADVDGDGDLELTWTVDSTFGASARPHGAFVLENDLVPTGTARFRAMPALDGAELEEACGLAVRHEGTAFGGVSDTMEWFDYDNDGDLDLFSVTPAPRCVVPPWLWVNESDEEETRFRRVQISVELAGTTPTGIAAADLDGDGDLEIVTHSWGQSIRRLFENTTNPAERDDAHFLAVAPRTRGRPARGVRVEIDLDGPFDRPDFAPGRGRLQHRTITARGRSNVSVPIAHFGLGAYTGPVAVRVFFPEAGEVVQIVEEIDRVVTIEAR